MIPNRNSDLQEAIKYNRNGKDISKYKTAYLKQELHVLWFIPSVEIMYMTTTA